MEFSVMAVNVNGKVNTIAIVDLTCVERHLQLAGFETVSKSTTRCQRIVL